MSILFRLIAVIFISASFVFGQLIIQENEAGFCAVDGQMMTSVAGYTGNGYADTDFGIGKSINWSIRVPEAATYYLQWRYGNGGDIIDRVARVLVNGALVDNNLSFPHTGTWTNWTISDSFAVDLQSGNNQIRIEATVSQGLGNYDYLIVHGENPSPGECVPFFILTVDQNDPEGGIVSYQPVQDYYSEGTEVTLAAQANPGYFFQSWSGDEPNAEAVFTFSMTNNVHATAIFLPAGTRMFPDAVGYATVQDDKGTPFMVFGGALGDSVFATSINELQTYLGSENPLIVTFSDSFFASMEINIKSNKTLLGVGDKAHLSGIGLNINGASNVILKNLTVSKVSPQDAVEINGKSRQILIDHCEFYSDRNHGTEFYDGLLDIKNESSFITVSWSKFHDHFKTILISSNDQSPQDSVTRVTFHHNYFYNCGSRLPSIRFGTAHIFNNYYENCESAINTRMGARVRIEKNYFFHTGNAVASDYSIKPGMVQLFDNIFVSSSYITEPTCEVGIPYDYEYLLNEPEELPRLLGGDVSAVDRISKLPLKYDICSYPNPFNPAVNINFTVPSSAHVEIDIFNALGQRIIKLADKYYSEGEHIIKWNAGSQASGIYYYRLKSEDFVDVKKMVLIR